MCWPAITLRLPQGEADQSDSSEKSLMDGISWASGEVWLVEGLSDDDGLLEYVSTLLSSSEGGGNSIAEDVWSSSSVRDVLGIWLSSRACQIMPT